jgi:hypothetical protein
MQIWARGSTLASALATEDDSRPQTQRTVWDSWDASPYQPNLRPPHPIEEDEDMTPRNCVDPKTFQSGFRLNRAATDAYSVLRTRTADEIRDDEYEEEMITTGLIPDPEAASHTPCSSAPDACGRRSSLSTEELRWTEQQATNLVQALSRAAAAKRSGSRAEEDTSAPVSAEEDTPAPAIVHEWSNHGSHHGALVDVPNPDAEALGNWIRVGRPRYRLQDSPAELRASAPLVECRPATDAEGRPLYRPHGSATRPSEPHGTE